MRGGAPVRSVVGRPEPESVPGLRVAIATRLSYFDAMSERLVFDTSVRSLFEAVPETAQASVAAEWKALGIDIHKLVPGYDVSLWWKAVECAARFFEGTPKDRLRNLGRGLTQRFTHSAIGRAAGPLGRLTGPQRSLRRAGNTFRSGNNYLRVDVEVDEPGHMRLRINEASPVGELLAGSIEEMVLYTGGLDPEVDLELRGDHTLYDVRWTAG